MFLGIWQAEISENIAGALTDFDLAFGHGLRPSLSARAR
jgi:hypothetical protein